MISNHGMGHLPNLASAATGPWTWHSLVVVKSGKAWSTTIPTSSASFVVTPFLPPLPPGLGLGGDSPADADAVIVLDLDLLGLAETAQVQAALLVEGSALLVEPGAAALANPVGQGAVAARPVLVPHGHAVDQGVGEPLDPPQGAGLTECGLLLPLPVVGRRTPGEIGRASCR